MKFKSPDLAPILATLFLAFSTLTTAISNPKIIFTNTFDSAVGWCTLGVFAICALCFTIAPAISDLKYSQKVIRKAGAQFAIAAVLLLLMLMSTFSTPNTKEGFENLSLLVVRFYIFSLFLAGLPAFYLVFIGSGNFLSTAVAILKSDHSSIEHMDRILKGNEESVRSSKTRHSITED